MLNLLMNRRSIRKYKDKAIEKEKIDQIIKGALTSPSGRNIKPWELIVVDDKEILSELGTTRGPASRPISNAPLAIVVLGDPEATDVWIEDASVISTIIQLVSESIGLGSCWIQVRQRYDENKETVEKSVKSLLNIPDKYNVESMIAIGYPDENKNPHQDTNLKYEKVHFNSF